MVTSNFFFLSKYDDFWVFFLIKTLCSIFIVFFFLGPQYENSPKIKMLPSKT
jgi:hypothetical protein